MSCRFRSSITVFVLCAVTAPIAAQKPPGLGYVYPPVIRAGETRDVQLGGYDFTTDLEWFVHDHRVKLTTLGPPGDYLVTPPPYWFGPRASSTPMPISREVPARIAVSKDMPAGLVRWQVANANGSSATAVFYVSRGEEIVESRSRDFPQKLAKLPIAVSGRLSRLTEVDRYEWTADRDTLVSVELMNRRLGSDFNGVVEVRDAKGEVLADLVDTQGLDGALTFAARAGQTYTISLHDADYRGDRAYVYRLAIFPGPRVVCTLPAAGERGTTRDVEFVGVGVATGKPVLETIKQKVMFPADPAITSLTYTLKTPFGTADVTIPLSDMKQVVDGTTLDGPAAITRRCAPNVTEERISWNVQKDEDWAIDARSRGVGGALDLSLTVLGPDGKPIGDNDDLPGTTDAGFSFRAAAAGTYTCVVRTITPRRGMPDEIYQLSLRRRSADFSLTVPQRINLPAAGSAEVDVKVQRTGDFKGEIAVTVEGLPPGVSPQGEWKIPAGKSEAKLTIKAEANAAVVARSIQLVGTAQVGETKLVRRALAPAAGNLAPRLPNDERIPNVLLAMTMAAPFEMTLVDHERQNAVHRGSTHRAEWIITRKNGFTGPINIEMSAQQDRYRQGTRGPIVTVPANADRAIYPCFLPEWLPTDLTRRIVVHGVAGIKDPAGNMRQVSKAGDARITMICEGALLKLTAANQRPTVRLGESFDVPVTVSRSAKLPVAAKIELVVPEEAAGLIRAEGISLPADVSTGTIRVTSSGDPRLAGPWTLRLMATALEDGKWPVVSEADIEVEFAGR